MSEPLTPAQTAGRLTAALATIRDLWTDTLQPIARSTGGGHGDPRMIDVCNLRQEVAWQLSGWAILLVDDLNLDAPTHTDVPDLCDWLTTHRDDLANHTAATDALTEIEDCAEAVTNLVFGHHRPRLALGACTITGCDGTVRDAGLDDYGLHNARCTRCHTTAVVSWWAEQMRINTLNLLTDSDVVDLAHRQFGRRITPSAIKMAVNRGRLTPIANTTPRAYELRDVIAYLSRR